MTVDAVGGIWTYGVDLAAELCRHGIAVTLAVLGPAPNSEQRHAVAAAGAALVDLGHQPEWLADGPQAVLRAGEALAALARETGAELVHLNHPSLAAGAAFDNPVLAVCHSCVATWWRAVKGGGLPEAWAWQADLVGAGYRAADRVIAPTAAFAQATAAAYGLDPVPTVVFNGRASEAADHTGPLPRRAMAVGRLWDDGKDVATLDRAAARTDVPLQAAGPLGSPDGGHIALNHIAALGARSAEEVRGLLAARPIFASAARYEPFGLSVLEAAQAGCALVLSDIPTHRELWEGAALFAPVGDDAQFAAAIDRLADDPAGRRRAGAAARRRADRYTLEACAARLLDLYATLAQAPGPVEGSRAA